MSDWKKYKGEGPWDFTKSPPKNHYNEGSHISSKDNPVWKLDRVIPTTPTTPVHNPHCGYWPNLTPTTPESDPGEAANIFGLFSAGASIWGCYWDGISSLTYIGYYNPNDGEDLNCLIIDSVDDTLVTVGGAGSTASIRKIGTTPAGGVFPLTTEIFPFNNYDALNAADRSILVRNEDDGVVYYIEGAAFNRGGTMVELDGTAYTKNKRSYLGTVTTGTDGNLYHANYVYAQWRSQTKPITGEAWHLDWDRIPDDSTDGDITVYGHGSVAYGTGTKLRAMYWQDQIWTLHTVSPSSSVRKYWPADLHLMNKVVPQDNPHGFVGYGDHIYTVEGNFFCMLRKYTDGFMVFVDEVYLDIGRADEIIEMGDSLIVLNNPYTEYNVLYKINPSTLTIENTYEFPQTDLWQRIIAIDDRYLAIGGNQYAMVFDIISWQIMDTVYLDDDNIGYSTQVMAVQNL